MMMLRNVVNSNKSHLLKIHPTSSRTSTPAFRLSSSSGPSSSNQAAKAAVGSPNASAGAKDNITKKALGIVLKHVWPKGNDIESRKIKLRVVVSLSLLVGSKVVLMSVPFIFKALVDELNKIDNNQQHGSATESMKSGRNDHIDSSSSSDSASYDAATSTSNTTHNNAVVDDNRGNRSEEKGLMLSTINVTPAALVATPLSLVFMYGLARSVASATTELRDVVFSKVSQTAIRVVAKDSFTHLHSLDLGFHLSRRTGALTSTLDRGRKSISSVLSFVVVRIVPTVVEIGLVSSILASQCGIRYVGVSLATLGVYTAFTVGITQWRTQFRKRMNKVENEASARLFDSLINYETVAYFGNQAHEANLYDKSLKEYEDASIKTQTSLSMLNFGQQAIFNAGLTATMYFAAQEVANGTMTIGDVVLVNGLLFQLSVPLNFFGTIYRETRQALTDMEEMVKLREKNTKIFDKKDAVPLNITEAAKSYKGPVIEFDNVSFKFDEQNHNILNGISFSVPLGQTIAVVGTSGSGKSTLLRLLLRFMDPASGSVRIMGKDVRDVTLASLRGAVGVVAQDTVLFNDTLRYNITYGDLSQKDNEEKIKEVIKGAQLEEAIQRMPNGWNTLVGERGLKLSGGEKQRVSIARCLLKNAPLLVCDEPTSSLDTRTGSEIMKSLKSVAENRLGTIIVAHRLSDIRDADQIIVLDKGRVVEQGTHEKLLDLGNDGLYFKLWSEQIKKEHPVPISSLSSATPSANPVSAAK